MVDKKKVNKKPSKSVLDYDPLAWLNEVNEPESAETLNSVEPVNAVVKNQLATGNVISETEINTSVSKKKTVNKSGIKKSVAKKSVTKEATATRNEAYIMNKSNEDSEGFGFFDEAPEPAKSESDESVKVTESEQGFGFFTDNIETEPEEEKGYGFFDQSEQLSTQSAAINEQTNVIDLGAELTIRSVAACKALVDESMSNGFDVRLSARDLQKIDTAGLQLIYSLKNTLEKTSQSINWVDSNSIINQAAKFIGMPPLIESSDEGEAYGFFSDEIGTQTQNKVENDSAFGFF